MSYNRVARALSTVATAFLMLALAAFSAAQPAMGDEEIFMSERIKISLDELGNARVSLTFTYPDELYEDLEDLVDEYPDFLANRYLLGETMKEIEEYEVEMNDKKHQVVISYYSPGYAYNWGDHWAVQGFPDEPVDESGLSYTFEKEYTGNDDLTLYRNVYIERSTRVELPESAINARYDGRKGAILYEIPQKEEASLIGRNRVPLAVVFGILSIAFIVSAWAWLAISRKRDVAGDDHPDAAKIESGEPG